MPEDSMSAAASNSSTAVATSRPLENGKQSHAATARSAYNRMRLGMMIIASVVTLLAFAVYMISALQWRNSAFFGAMLTPHMVVDGSRSIGSPNWSGLTAGLERLDRILSINGQDLAAPDADSAAARAGFRAIVSTLRPGDTVDLVFLRPVGSIATETDTQVVCDPQQDGLRTCRLSYVVSELPGNDFITYFVIPWVIGLLIVMLGVVMLYLRPHQPTARLTALFCLTLGLFMGGLFDVNNTYTLIPIWLVGTMFIGAALSTLALTFPVNLTLIYRYPVLNVLPFAVSVGLTAVSLFLYFVPPSPYSFPDTWQIGLFWGAFGVLILSINLYRRRRLAVSPAVRDQSNTTLIGMVLAGAPIIFWMMNTLAQQLNGRNLIPLNTSAIMPFFLMPPLALVYAVLQYRTLDTDRIITQAITYTLMLVGLVVGYFLLVFGASLITNQTLRLGANEFIVAITIFGIAVFFLPVRTFLQREIDRIYYRTRTAYQGRVEGFARSLSTLTKFEQFIGAYRQQLEETVSPSHTFIFLSSRQTGDYAAYGISAPETDVRFEKTSDLVDLLRRSPDDLLYLQPGVPWPPELRAERSRLAILNTFIIACLRGREDLIGFVVIAPSRAQPGTYVFEDLRFIENMTNQLALAVERAQAIESLERRVRELDVLSQVSQAVNFTIEYDDLLELIFAQTDRLVRAPYFYIALRDRGTDKLYYAFLVENEDRFEQRENRRWLMGNDLISEVLREGLPRRTDDYSAEMARRNSPIVYESAILKAWMGVPLIAGTTTLGVMAVANIEPGKTFSDDQYKIFGDIAALAATSLDKARLFAETNLRARQLAALNTISQQLASELNVENLLDLITRSAVEILDAEAGSLLLNVEDDPKSFEFKVAVGGSGKDLVGKRFPRNKGLVGEVATSNRYVIVNDATNDPRWGGEVSKGGFSTNAVLAVPLVAQNKVIGVLEVLNKKGGGVYVKEDADLLTTFAGQAAVAIENARLFQMTDLQLGQRVAELQAMERIDVELNRSLDLQKVAEITMRWAIANSAATAGALGIVVGDAPTQHLQIIAKYGYLPEDFPQGADENLWPLEKGIVSRVMRTRQPDLANDVKIDPNYVPSLRGSLSQLTIPMISGGEINAILILEKDKEPRLSLVDMSFAQRLAEHASIAIANAQFYAELTRANDSKSEFVSFVAHELKTPMTSMKGFTDLLLSGVVGKMNDQQNNFLNTIRSNIDRMNTLVSDLNDVTKLQTNKLRMEFANVDFRNVVNETLRPLHKQIEDKSQKLTMDMPERMPLILADQNRLIQVMTNMVSNAYKYSPPEGEIIISTEVMEHQRDAKGKDLGPMLHIQVRDTGIGMSEEDLNKLFTPYFRSENPLTRQQPGTGLGLTITRGIVVGHGGQIWVESELGKGTSFHFTVPIVAESLNEEPERLTQPVK
jgi:signal transduction histidine kinase